MPFGGTNQYGGAVTCARCKRTNIAGKTYCVSCGARVDPPDIGDLPSGTSTTVGPGFFVRPTSTAKFDDGANQARRQRPRVRLSLALPILLVMAEFAWVLWHTSIPLPDSRPVILIAKLVKSFRSEPKQEFRASTVAMHVMPLQTAAAPVEPAKQPAVGTASTRRIPPPATLHSEEKFLAAAGSRQEQVIPARDMSDSTTAAESLKRAMAKGDPNAPVRLANMYFTGEGVRQSCQEALSLLLTAARKPNVRARNRLASMYAIGTCVQRDRVQAYRWLASSLAVDPNDTWARQNRALTWREMTPEERNVADADQ